MTEKRTFTATHPGRLDRIVHALMDPGISRSAVSGWIREELVQVNGETITKPGYALTPGDEIQVTVPAPETRDVVDCGDVSVEIVFEDEYLAVVNKPSGIAVHPAPTVKDLTLVDILINQLDKLSTVAGPERSGIVHRLDRETSGLLIVAKDDAAHNRLTDMFQERQIVKIYKAIVYGKVRDPEGTLSFSIGRSSSDRKKMAVRRDGRSAITHYKLTEHMGMFSAVNLSLETGRTHQIRVHLTHVGHPIVGDKLYGTGRWKGVEPPEIRKLVREFPRHALHAAFLRFQHPITGETIECRKDLPGDLEELLNSLREADAASRND